MSSDMPTENPERDLPQSGPLKLRDFLRSQLRRERNQ